MHRVPGVRARDVWGSVGVHLQGGMGRAAVQPRPQPVLQPAALSERRHVLQRQVSVAVF